MEILLVIYTKKKNTKFDIFPIQNTYKVLFFYDIINFCNNLYGKKEHTITYPIKCLNFSSKFDHIRLN